MVVVLMNRLGVRTVAGYLIVGAGIWLCTLKSGIHPTISGVVLGLLTPAVPLISRNELGRGLRKALNIVEGDSREDSVKLTDVMEEVDFTTRESISPLERFEADVHPWAAFVIMPIFALANAGVEFSTTALLSPVSIAIALALLVGKPLGIILSLGFVVKMRLGIMPGGANWKAVMGGSCLAGIGFTMSLFVASLGLEGILLSQAKTGILVGSGISGVLGISLLVFSFRKKPED
jgi:NhaA family Na+:H+ antiporter